ncbi:MAG: N-acetylmuramoyl-L-alanine amidase [Oscillospiraceae bacterium]|nr:N-acetylmuramoyl-L-alanine amidase [Oscillospiraceae bacterium]
MDWIDKDGFLTTGKVIRKDSYNGHSFKFSYGEMTKVNGIVVHQTADTETAEHTLNGYTSSKTGAQFLIDKDGTIYQTASLYVISRHVGHIRARCLREMTCPQVELDAGLKVWNERSWVNKGAAKSHENEKNKEFPDRFPKNEDSIGIECVGKAWKYDKQGKKLKDQKQSVPDKQIIFDPLTDKQVESLDWLLRHLSEKFEVPFSEIYRHPEIAFKIALEAKSAEKPIDNIKNQEVEAEAAEQTEIAQ